LKGLFIGSGSISRLHRDIFCELRPDAKIAIMSRRPPSWMRPGDQHWTSLDQAAGWKPTMAVIANPCVFHIETAARLIGEGIPVLLEKPIGSDDQDADSFVKFVINRNVPLCVAYDLRWHPAAVKMQQLLDSGVLGKPVNLLLEVGQDLREWRSNIDYRESVSARKSLGGGVLLELSHEIDLALGFLKTADGAAGRIGKISDLEIDVEDTANLVIWNERFAASIQMDFLQRPTRRFWRFVGTKGSVSWEFNHPHVLQSDFESGLQTTVPLAGAGDPHYAYREQMVHFLNEAKSGSPNYEGLLRAKRVLDLIRIVRDSHPTPAYE